MYLNTPELLNAAIEAIINSWVFDEDRLADTMRRPVTPAVVEPVVASRRKLTAFEAKRNLLLSKKKANNVDVESDDNTVDHKIRKEVAAFLNREPIDIHRNPLKFYRENEKEYPYLSRYVKNNAHFQPTSVASERLFNKDSLICTPRRSSLAPEVAESLSLLQDYLSRREDDRRWQLCSECPGNRTRYNIQCYEHNH